MITHSNILAWRIPWTEEPGGLQSMGSQESDRTEWLNHQHQQHIHRKDIPMNRMLRCTPAPNRSAATVSSLCSMISLGNLQGKQKMGLPGIKCLAFMWVNYKRNLIMMSPAVQLSLSNSIWQNKPTWLFTFFRCIAWRFDSSRTWAAYFPCKENPR